MYLARKSRDLRVILFSPGRARVDSPQLSPPCYSGADDTGGDYFSLSLRVVGVLEAGEKGGVLEEDDCAEGGNERSIVCCQKRNGL